MDILQEAIQVLVQPPGDVVYFLVTLFALQQALVVALSSTRTQGGVILARRWAWIVGGLLAGRMVLIGVGLLGISGLVDPAVVLPPLERWLILAGGIGLIWAGLLGHHPQRWQTVGLWIALGLSLLAFGAAAALRVTSADLQDASGGGTLWQQVVVLVGLALSMILSAVLRPPEWEWALVWGCSGCSGLWPNGSGPIPRLQSMAGSGWRHWWRCLCFPSWCTGSFRNRQRPVLNR